MFMPEVNLSYIHKFDNLTIFHNMHEMIHGPKAKLSTTISIGMLYDFR